MSTELIYSDFASNREKSPFHLQPILGSMIALSDDMHISPPLNQKSTLPRITNEDVNTITPPAKVPLLTNIYIGSLTVVGLFILFRFIQKHP